MAQMKAKHLHDFALKCNNESESHCQVDLLKDLIT